MTIARKYPVLAGSIALLLAAGATSAQAGSTARDSLPAAKAAHAAAPASIPGVTAAAPAMASAAAPATVVSKPIRIVLPSLSTTLATSSSAASTPQLADESGYYPVPQATAAVYFSAHPDDFLLFQNPFPDAAANARMIYIFVTAGDAGLGVGPSNAPYYLAREAAAIKAIRFMADAARPWAETATPSNVSVNGHPIYKYSYRSSVAYFLRLPDGNGGGEGFPGTGNVSIVKLYKGGANILSAVDNSTTYNGWKDLSDTVTAIVKSEIAGQPYVTLNANDTDESKNPGDHHDHYATGALASAVKNALPCTYLASHMGYALAGMMTLSGRETVDKSGAFASYATGLNENNYFGAWDNAHKAWLNGLVKRNAGAGYRCNY